MGRRGKHVGDDVIGVALERRRELALVARLA